MRRPRPALAIAGTALLLAAALRAEPAQGGLFEYFPSTRDIICLCDLGTRVLVGTEGGLVVLEPGTGRRERPLSGAPVGDLCPVFGEPDCALVASEHGLYRYERGVLARLTEGPATAVLFSADGLVTGHPKGEVAFWQGGEVVSRVVLPTRAPVHDIERVGDDLFAAAIDGVWRITGDRAEKQTLSRDPLSTTVFPLVMVNGRLYAGTAAGLFRWAEGEWVQVPMESGPAPLVLSIGPGRAAENWELTVGGDVTGLFALVDGRLRQVWEGRVPVDTSRRWVAGPVPQMGDRVLGFTAIAGGDHLFLGTAGEGLWEWPAGGEPRSLALDFRNAGEPAGNDISSVAWARHTRKLYVGTNVHGMACLAGGKWSHATVETGFPDNWVNQVATDGSRLFVRNSSGNVFTPDAGGGWRQVGKKGDGWPKDWSSGLGEAGNRVWAGTYSAFYLDGPGGWEVHIPKPQLQSKFVVDVALRGKEVWLATSKTGLLCWNRAADTWLEFSQGTGITDTWVTCVETFGGEVWAGTFAGGLCRYAAPEGATPPGKWSFYRASDSPATVPADRINCLLATDRELWIGTLSGITRTDGKTWSTFGLEEGLPSDSVRSLCSDGEYLWVGTDGGLCRASLAVLRAR